MIISSRLMEWLCDALRNPPKQIFVYVIMKAAVYYRRYADDISVLFKEKY